MTARGCALVRLPLLCLMIGCGSGGKSQEITTSIDGNGGSFEIAKEGHPYDGFKLTVPAGTFGGTSDWSFGVVTDPDLPALPSGYTVSGPALKITTDQTRGEHLMTLDVPVTRTDGQGVVVAYYDPDRKVFEVFPTVGETETSIQVMTGHLRPELLLGPVPGDAKPSRRGPGTPRGGDLPADPASGWLMPISVTTPLPPVQQVVAAALRWPVLDRGSEAFPEGHSLAIAAFQAMAAARKAGPFTDHFKALDTPGFYSDAAPLAAGILAQRKLAETLSALIAELTAALEARTEADRAAMTGRVVVANMGLTGHPGMLALREGGGLSLAPWWWVNPVAGSEDSLSLWNPASAAQDDLQLSITSNGIAPLQLPTGDGTSVTVSQAVPVPSFVMPYERIDELFRLVQQITEKYSETAKAITESLASEAGLPSFDVEMRMDPSSEWGPIEEGKLIVRSETAELRLNPALGPFVVHGGDGSELARSDGAEIAVAAVVAGLQDLFTDLSITIQSSSDGVPRQRMVSRLPGARALLVVSPASPSIAPGQTQVMLDAQVDFPPSGFLLRWEWGDGEMTEIEGMSTATHEYATVGEYTIKVTLLISTTLHPLATATVRVNQGNLPFWRLDTFAGEDGYHNGGTGSGDPLARLLAAPNAGLITVTESTIGGILSLYLRVLDTGTWDPAVCCPPVAEGPERLVPMGKQPAFQELLGPYFSAYATSSWSQSSEDLNTGTMTGGEILGKESYTIPDVGVQDGPAGRMRIQATRNGTSMTGTLHLRVWYVDENEELSGTEEFDFPFTATRLR